MYTQFFGTPGISLPILRVINFSFRPPSLDNAFSLFFFNNCLNFCIYLLGIHLGKNWGIPF